MINLSFAFILALVFSASFILTIIFFYKLLNLNKIPLDDYKSQIEELKLHFNISEEEADFIICNHKLYQKYQNTIISSILKD